MITIFRWLLRSFAVLSILFLLVLGLIYYFATQSLPNYNHRIENTSLHKPVEIIRDNKAVPHIFGETDTDIFFALGFAHAQDRMWQMMIARRTAQGRLSEIFGTETLKSDTLMRHIGLYQSAVKAQSHQTPQTTEILKAYSKGVNAWFDVITKKAHGRGAPEYFFFQPKIEPWRPADSIALLKLFAFQNTPHLKRDILRARTIIAVGFERADHLMLSDPRKTATDLSPTALLPPQAPIAPLAPRHSLHSLPPIGFEAASNLWAALPPQAPIAPLAPRHSLHSLPPIGFEAASNLWAAHPTRTASKASLLAADPHNGLTAPGKWMLARLELQSGGVIGATIPGIPAILAGRSNALAWGFSASYTDDIDLFLEKLNPENTQEYSTGKSFKPFHTSKIILNIKDSPSITLTLRQTENGPVLPNDHFGIKQITPIHHVISLRSPILEPKDPSLSHFIDLLSIKTADKARKSFKGYVTPALNVIFADRNNIAYQLIGALPQRNIYHMGKGKIPAQGWLEHNRWHNYYPYSENPTDYNPQSGILANTNNKITDSLFPRHISHDWGDHYRITRLKKLMSEREIHTRDSFMEAQLDTISFAARTTLPLIAKNLWFDGKLPEPGTKEEIRQKALDLLANWTGEMNEHTPEPLIYTAWLHNLQKFLIRDELGLLAKEFSQTSPIFIERVMRDINGASIWCDIRSTKIIETCQEISRQALDYTLAMLKKNHGDKIESWHWGSTHQAAHDHQVFGNMPLINWISNIRQSTSGGDHTLMRAQSSHKGATPFRNVHAAGFRMLIDFSDLESSLYITATGQSGHLLSRFYDDLSQMWRRGEYIPMALNTTLIRAGAIGITHLKPPDINNEG